MLRFLSPTLVACLLALIVVAQTPNGADDAGNVLRLRVRVKSGESTKGLSRKRFFLFKGSLEQNKPVVEATLQRQLTSRDCFYRRAGASEALIKWLKESDCESVYCREIETEDTEGAAAVPEFVTALATGEKEFGSRDLGRKWLTVNLPENLREGYYKLRQNELQETIKQAEAISGARVLSVMTDRNGTAYFTGLEPGTYTLTNIIAAEIGPNSAIWNCEVPVKQDDRAFEKPFLIMNRNDKKDKNVKCVAVEKPLPVCESAAK